MHVFKTANKWHISVNGGYAVFNDNLLVGISSTASGALDIGKRGKFTGGVYMSDSGTFQIDNAADAERMVEEYAGQSQ